MEELIPPGFRFYPTEEELVSFYLHKKLQGKREELDRVIPVVHIYDLEPWNLPEVSGEVCHGDTEQWFFFVPRQEREAKGGRPNRTTASGYWKATGSPSYVYSSNNKVIGVKKTMIFYEGKAPLAKKTKWKMNEYRVIEGEEVPKLRHELSLCRVYVISGSFRAFDRRPLGSGSRLRAVQEKTDINRSYGVAAASSSHDATMMDKRESPENSLCSGSGDPTVLEKVGYTNTDSWDMENGSGPDPLLEWEQLNLL